MSSRVWVRCKQCESENISPIIFGRIMNERVKCPECKANWHDSKIIAKVDCTETIPEHVIWLKSMD